ncbi:efflux RND transporter periplasmic adaptor subunit [Pseudoxanthomonas sacheonensis]|uniref:efflux RND transporter periplasmic adaptor subunit n=1 Tax=Pseudoxanthomonas sacheonensis TaxID=443615 RepID=UPI001BABC392|nr:efflux RND transporter periplasmic adaptor subunit [Pseudoxanthomonas sacheonensis]
MGLIAWLGRPDSNEKGVAGQAASALTVTVETLKKETWPQTVRASGAFTAWQEIIVSPETGGLRIAEVVVDVGAKVKKGQLLARLADDSLLADRRKQEAAVAQAQANLQQAASNSRRAKVVGDSGALSEQQLEEYRINETTTRAALASAQADLESIKLKLRQTRIVAPDDGVVASKTATLGDVVNIGDELYRIVRQNRIEWGPEFDSRQVAAIKTGQLARIALPSGEQVQGTVRMVGPTLSTDTGRAIVYVSLPVDSAARSGMFGSGVIELDSKEAMTLPQAAVVLRDGRSYVYVVGSDQSAVSHVVTTGRGRDGRIEVLSGIDARQRVVASGGAFLSEGARVTVIAANPSKSNTGSAK